MFDVDYALQILPALLRGARVTVLATGLGTAIAMLLGLVWAVGLRSERVFVAFGVRQLVEFVRGTPLLIQLYVLYFGLPALGLGMSGLVTGVVGLGVHYSAYTAEVYRAGIEAVPRGQWEAAAALNMSPRRTLLSVILPQAIPPMIPALGNYLVAMFKETPLLSAIAVVEMLQVAKVLGAEEFRYLEPMTLVGLLFLVVSTISARAIRTLEERCVVA